MSIEFKNSRWGRNRNSRLFKKTRRAAMKKIDAPHLPMRVQTGKNGYWGQTAEYPADFPLHKLRKFLETRVGKPVDKVFSEFLIEAKKFNQKVNLEDAFHSFIEYEEWRLKIGSSSGFYISNGILNFKKGESFKKPLPKKLIKYNNEHWDNSILNIFEPLNNVGPSPIGKFWVDVNGQYMLLPVYAVYSKKWEYGKGECDDYSTHLMGKKRNKKCDYLEDFIECKILGRGYFLTVDKPYLFWDKISLTKSCDFLYIVRIFDIENYKKETFKK